jgi:predicted dehydrogenase
MLERERLDFVDIVTTMPSHRALVTLAAAHGVSVIVQKPFAPTWADCLAMVEACRTAGVRLMVHENFRFQSPMLAVREALSGGAVGEITWARVSWRTAYDIYAGQPYLAKEERFLLLDIGVHVLDLVRVLVGEVERVYAETQSIRPGIAGEDAATLLLRHRSGAVSVVDGCYASRRDPDPFPERSTTGAAPRSAPCAPPPCPGPPSPGTWRRRASSTRSVTGWTPGAPAANPRPRVRTTSRPTRLWRRPTKVPAPTVR